MASEELQGERRPKRLREPHQKERHPLYPEFGFQHPFSMLVVGPTQSGKTDFVEQMLTNPLIKFPTDQDVQVTWF